MKYRIDDTIAAVATPPGIGGIAVIRVSGTDAPGLVAPLFKPSGRTGLLAAESHRLLHGWIETEHGTLDEVMVVHMKAPRSYTGQEVVEVHCHGGVVVAGAVLDAICGRGARLAEPGEFTFRAFTSGRMDLTQVEAVLDVIRAPSRAALRVSVNQLRGRLRDSIEAARESVRHVSALVNASIDFPEEDVSFTHRGDSLRRITAVRDSLAALVASADQGRILREGLAVAIAGKPNVGKSSLLNALLRENRAIVTDIPGTTRDTIEAYIERDGMTVRVIDTAGIRDTAEPIEREGVIRSRRAIEQADLTLLVLDGSRALDAQDRALMDSLDPAATIAVINKSDLFGAQEPAWAAGLAAQRVTISAQTGAGLTGLESALRRWAALDERPAWEQPLITNMRQKHAATKARAACEDAIAALERNAGEELVAVDLARVLDALGDIVGETTAEDLLDRIFAEFCIGK